MLFAIGDLHLGRSVNKPMNRFGDVWRDHENKIIQNWRETVSPGDTVILCGDTSWAMTMAEFEADFALIRELPGRKIIIQGNHDYWWDGTGKLNRLDPDVVFLKNNCANYGDYHICGVRGWLCPAPVLPEHDEKIYRRDAARLRLSLDAAMKDGARRIIAALHFPPQNERSEPSLYSETLREYPVEAVAYGHLHGETNFRRRPISADLPYYLVSADFLHFRPKKLLD